MTDLPRLARTVAPLKPIQLYGRLWFRLAKPRPDHSPAPPRRPCGEWTPPIRREPSITGPQSVTFLNRPGSIADAGQWNDPGQDKLWLYNLHYFDDLTATSGGQREDWRRSLVNRWIAENPPGHGNGWEPYPLSLRIVNWIKWTIGGAAPEPQVLDSLAVQARWLVHRLEWHLLGNHLLANAKALVFAGLFFEGAEADRWLALGLKILTREFPEQVLADGGHFERSPMYHAIVLEDLLDLLNLARTYGRAGVQPFAGWGPTAARMGDWAAAMVHPDGDIPFFNDSAFGIAPRVADLGAYAARLGLPGPAPVDAPLRQLEASGYVRVQQGAAVAFLDLAPVGPDYLPGHAHADTLSFEFSLGSERIVVNGGTSTYQPGPRREAERATRAHSTVEIDGLDSSEVWSSFRVGRRARVQDIAVRSDGFVTVSAAHDGYGWRPGRPVHRRTWTMEPRRLVVRDAIEGRAGSASARFHLPHGVSAAAEGDGRTGRIMTASGRELNWRASAPLTVETSSWSPRFGAVVGSQTLVADAAAGLETEFSW